MYNLVQTLILYLKDTELLYHSLYVLTCDTSIVSIAIFSSYFVRFHTIRFLKPRSP